MESNDKISFVNYDDTVYTYVTSNLHSPSNEKYEFGANALVLPLDKDILPTVHYGGYQPKLLINIYKPNDPNTDYNRTINLPIFSNSLFIYLSNNENSGYSGGSGGGTASIGNNANTFGMITGQWDNTSKIPRFKINGMQEYGFQNLDETATFKLYHHSDNKIYNMTPKQSIDYLLHQLSDLIKKNKYEYVILPCELNPVSKETNYLKYTLGSGIFKTSSEIKKYIYENICNIIHVSQSNNWQLITDLF